MLFQRGLGVGCVYVCERETQCQGEVFSVCVCGYLYRLVIRTCFITKHELPWVIKVKNLNVCIGGEGKRFFFKVAFYIWFIKQSYFLACFFFFFCFAIYKQYIYMILVNPDKVSSTLNIGHAVVQRSAPGKCTIIQCVKRCPTQIYFAPTTWTL